MGISLTVLGPVRAWRGDVELDLGSPQQRGVVGLLALNAGKPTGGDELIHALWGDDVPRGAPGTIRTYMYQLRQILSKAVLESSSSGYRLAAGTVSVDLDEFCRLFEQARVLREKGALASAARRLEAATALWQGPALTGARGHYVGEQRGWLDELRLAALEGRFSLAVQRGHHAEAVPDLTALVAAEPLRERMRELLRLALYRSGRQADALASYRDLDTLLRGEHGLDPGPTLRQSHQRILRSDPALLTAHAPRRLAAADHPRPSAHHPSSRPRCTATCSPCRATTRDRRDRPDSP